MQFYISDLHLGHAKALEFDNRPFCTVDEQNAVVIERWNETVGPKDAVYILGDFLWDNDLLYTVVSQLNGKKFLVTGNHDKIVPAYRRYITEVLPPIVKIRYQGNTYVLSHYPIAHWEMADYGAIHLYGHIHAGRDSIPFLKYKQEMLKRDLPYHCYNVGCMLPYMDYTPRTIEEIIQGGDAYEREILKTME